METREGQASQSSRTNKNHGKRLGAALLPLILVAAYLNAGPDDCDPDPVYYRPYNTGWSQHVQAARIKVISAGDPWGDEPYVAVINFEATFGSSNSARASFVDDHDIGPATLPGQTDDIPIRIGAYRVQDKRALSTADTQDVQARVPIFGQLVLAVESDVVGWDPPLQYGADGVRARMLGVSWCLQEQLEMRVANGQWGQDGIGALMAIADVAAAVQNEIDNKNCELPAAGAASATYTQKIDKDDQIGIAVTLSLGISESDYETLQTLAALSGNPIGCETPVAQPVDIGKPSIYFSICPFGTRTVKFPLIGSNAHWELTTVHRRAQTPSRIWFTGSGMCLFLPCNWSLVPYNHDVSRHKLFNRPEVTSGLGDIVVNNVPGGWDFVFPDLREAEAMAWYEAQRLSPHEPEQKILAAGHDTVTVTGGHLALFGTARSSEPYAWALFETLPTYTAAGNNPSNQPIHVGRWDTGSYTVYFEDAWPIENVMIHSPTPGAVCTLNPAVSWLDSSVVAVLCFGANGARADAKFYVQAITGLHPDAYRETYAYFDHPTANVQTANPELSNEPFAGLPKARRLSPGIYEITRDHVSLHPLYSTPLVTAVGDDDTSCYVFEDPLDPQYSRVGCYGHSGGGHRDTNFMVRWIMSENAVP